jgi:hypothetical protein
MEDVDKFVDSIKYDGSSQESITVGIRVTVPEFPGFPVPPFPGFTGVRKLFRKRRQPQALFIFQLFYM